MTKRTWNGRKRSCKTLWLACPFWVFVKFFLTKIEKIKKRKLLPFVKIFSLANEVFLIFAKVFYAKFVPKTTIWKRFCQKFRDFLIRRKFLPLKYELISCGCDCYFTCKSRHPFSYFKYWYYIKAIKLRNIETFTRKPSRKINAL